MKWFLVVVLLSPGALPSDNNWHGTAATFSDEERCWQIAKTMNRLADRSHNNKPPQLAYLPTPTWLCYSEDQYVRKFGVE